MPAGTPVTPRARPAGLTGLGGLPEGKVEGVTLLVVDLHALAGAHLVKVAAGEDAVVVVRTHREVHVAVVGHVGVALLDEGLDHLLHGLDLVRGARADVGIEDAKAMHLLDEGVGELLCHIGGGTALLIGTVDDLVVHVGEVLGKGDLVALVHEVAADHVKREERARVANVNLVIDGGATDIHANLARLDGLELLLPVRLGIVDAHGLLLGMCAQVLAL